MSKRVLDVGQCGLDHGTINRTLQQRFGAAVDQAHDLDDAIERLERQSYDLVLVNRLLDCDGSEGLEVIRRIRSEPRWNDVPVMLVSNYPDWQERAVRAGAVPGFGKASLSSRETLQKLEAYLGSS